LILAVCLNLALDLTYRVDELRPHETNRVKDVASRAGGKAVNVARVLDALGHEVVVTGFAGGRVGDAARAEMEAAGLTDATVPVAGETRRTLIVLEDGGGEPTGISEPGPEIAPAEWEAFVAAYRALAREAAAVALSGSLPPGVPVDAYAVLARESRAPVLLDTSGEALRHGVRGAPAIVKPNRLELAELEDTPDVVVAAQRLRQEGPESVVVSAGAEGLLAVTPEGVLRAAPPEAVDGNPIGAGDAAAAALVAGLVAGTPWPELLADAVALSAAAVHAPVAGSFDADAYARYLATA
jgi:tagatose 6-phosphate kinase